MCIAIITTAHPQYPFILLNNRDEYLHRPTAPAHWWQEPHAHVLGGYDLYRPVHGTWLGITRQGRVALLTNFREEGATAIQDERSRGAIPIAWLQTPPGADERATDFAQRLVDQGMTKQVGGFSMLYGHVQDVVGRQQQQQQQQQENGHTLRSRHCGLAVISNRTPDEKGLIWLASAPGETHALSNTRYDDNSWPKVVEAKASLKAAVTASVAACEPLPALLDRLFAVLSVNTLPRPAEGKDWVTCLRHSIFIPDIGRDADVATAASGIYGTQKQTVILADRHGNVTFVERTLFDDEGMPVAGGKEDRVFKFQIEGW